MFNETEPKELLLKCQCFSHGIELSKYDDDEDILISFWHYGFYNLDTMWNRIKSAWQILKRGRVSLNDFDLSKDDCKKLIEYLQEIYKEDK
jgi:hypothetical protein